MAQWHKPRTARRPGGSDGGYSSRQEAQGDSDSTDTDESAMNLAVDENDAKTIVVGIDFGTT